MEKSQGFATYCNRLDLMSKKSFSHVEEELKISSRRRTNDLIASQILKLCINGASKTRILYQANLNYLMAKQYLDNLMKHGFIAKEGTGSRITYRTTCKGAEYKEKFEQLQADLDGLYAIGD